MLLTEQKEKRSFPQVQLDLDLRAAGRRQTQNQDLLRHFLGNPVNSRIYYEGKDREEEIAFRLDR